MATVPRRLRYPFSSRKGNAGPGIADIRLAPRAARHERRYRRGRSVLPHPRGQSGCGCVDLHPDQEPLLGSEREALATELKVSASDGCAAVQKPQWLASAVVDRHLGGQPILAASDEPCLRMAAIKSALKSVGASRSGSRPRQTPIVQAASSNNPAAPIPPPMHIVTIPSLAPRRLPSISK